MTAEADDWESATLWQWSYKEFQWIFGKLHPISTTHTTTAINDEDEMVVLAIAKLGLLRLFILN